MDVAQLLRPLDQCVRHIIRELALGVNLAGDPIEPASRLAPELAANAGPGEDERIVLAHGDPDELVEKARARSSQEVRQRTGTSARPASLDRFANLHAGVRLRHVPRRVRQSLDDIDLDPVHGPHPAGIARRLALPHSCTDDVGLPGGEHRG